MLVKLQSRTYTDDFGMLVDGERPYIHMFESGIVRLGERMRPRQVVKVKARWMDKDVKVECKVAATDQEKRKVSRAILRSKRTRGCISRTPVTATWSSTKDLWVSLWT